MIHDQIALPAFLLLLRSMAWPEIQEASGAHLIYMRIGVENIAMFIMGWVFGYEYHQG